MFPQHPAPSLALPRMWGPEVESDYGPDRTGLGGGHEMTSNWLCHSAIHSVHIHRVPAVGQALCRAPRGSVVSTIGLSQAAYFSSGEVRTKHIQG